MPTLHIGPAVAEEMRHEVKGFTFIVIGDLGPLGLLYYIKMCPLLSDVFDGSFESPWYPEVESGLRYQYSWSSK